MISRPNFSKDVYHHAVLAHNYFQVDKIDPKDPKLTDSNAAVPHRMPWADLRRNVELYVNGKETKADLERWTDRFIEAAKSDISILKLGKSTKKAMSKDLDKLIAYINSSTTDLLDLRKRLCSAKTKKEKIAAASLFLKKLNDYFPNVPDLGPHRGVNIQVSDRGHLNVLNKRDLSPMSERVLDMSPHRFKKGIATTQTGEIVTTFGETVPLASLGKATKKRIDDIGPDKTNAHSIAFDRKNRWQ